MASKATAGLKPFIEVRSTQSEDSSQQASKSANGKRTAPSSLRAREFEDWLVYEDEKEAIREEAVLLQKRLHQLRRRWQSIIAAQADEQEAA